MRKVVHVTAVAAAGLVLLACNRPPERQAVAYAPLPPAQTYGNASYAHAGMPPALPPRTYGGAPYGRADIPPRVPPPQSYGRAPYGRADVPPQVLPPHAYDDASNERADAPQQEQRLVWKSSPRWATVRGEVNTPAVKRSRRRSSRMPKRRQKKSALKTLPERTSPALPRHRSNSSGATEPRPLLPQSERSGRL